jgi:hypothetical protein
MKRSMLVRVELLEAAAVRSRPVFLRYGWLANQLPEDYEGERHYVEVESHPTGSPNITWGLFEGRAGPAPDSALGTERR